MIEWIITFSSRNRGITFAAALFLGLWGIWCLRGIRIDAIPDLSETQVIIFSEWMGRSPDLVEDQITYPLVTAMTAAPGVRVVRGQSMFGMSFVYVIFEDGTDIYWARSRVLEYLSALAGRLPDGVAPRIGPDATGVGWVYQYVLIDESGQQDLSAIRAFQDWYLRYWLQSVPGVAEVATVGGFEKQYQVELDPNRMRALNVPLLRVVAAIRNSNQDVGGRTLEISEREHYVRGRGYVSDVADLERVTVGIGPEGVPIRVADVGRVSLGPDIRRGLTDLDGRGDVVSGVVVMRQGEDVTAVIDALKRRIEEVKPAFPPGLELRAVYDRSGLIARAVATMSEALFEEIVLICAVVLIFLFHLRSTLVVAVTLPLSVLIAMIPIYYLDVGLNVMSLAGIILAVGDIVDAIAIFVENSHKRLAESGDTRPRDEVVTAACRELGPSLFSALLVIAVSFLPIFALQAEEGRLFRPLAWTKTLAMLSGALVAITVTAPLIVWLARGRIRSEAENPVNRACLRLYTPLLRGALGRPRVVLGATGAAVLLSGVLFTRLGSEFMPPLWEGDLLYMPITMPGISVTAVSDLLMRQDAALRRIPEVRSVFGKAGRYETPTDPSPLSMLEVTIQLRPREEWRPGLDEDGLVAELDRAVAVPGLNRAWTKPVRGRIDMLSTGVRTPVGVKVFGRDLKTIESVGREIETALARVAGTRSVYAERIGGGFYVDFEPDREILQRYGLNVGDAQSVVETAIGGMEISETVEGRERYSVNVRYPRELRDDVEKLGRVIVSTPVGAQVPLAQLGRLVVRPGPPMILNENGSLVGYVYVDLEGRDTGGYVEDAKRAVAAAVELPPGTFLAWTGQYEHLERMQQRMTFLVPLTLVLVFALLYGGMRSTGKVLLVMASVPLSLVGGIVLMWWLGYNTSVAVWAGAIALIGVAVETASIMVVFLDQAWEDRRRKGLLAGPGSRIAAAMEGAERALRPVLMAVTTNLLGLVPIMAATGIGADVAKRIASPMFGGIVSLTVLTLVVIPVIHMLREGSRGAPRQVVPE